MIFDNDCNNTSELTAPVQTALSKLREEYSTWQRHQADSDNMLYVLLENCLEFYHFLRQNERYESAFKSVCEFKWNAKTKVTTLIAKSVFGDKNKKSSVYARAIEAAVSCKVGRENEPSMLAWLQANGGINGVIRSENPNTSARAALQDKKEEVGRNSSKYGIRCKVSPIVNENVKVLTTGEWLILCHVDQVAGELEVIFPTQSETLINLAYSEFGGSIMETDAYKRRHLAVEAELAVGRAEAHNAVGGELRRILENIKSKTETAAS